MPFTQSAGYSHVPQSSPTNPVPGSLHRPSLVETNPFTHAQIPSIQVANSDMHLLELSQFDPILDAEKEIQSKIILPKHYITIYIPKFPK